MALLGKEPKPGDVVEIFCTGYKHWAIYVGDGYVVHLAPPIPGECLGPYNSRRFLSKFLIVKRELLKDVATNCNYVVNNFWDQMYKPQCVNDILHTANKWLWFASFVIVRRDAKEFVTDLRYGLPKDQLERLSQGLLDYPVWMRRPRLEKKSKTNNNVRQPRS
ncbi:phospholipase A and acyltransferase 4-like [Sorex araneus]|uniref:phospholipase A and acyltransferase 4-like n=1 Tax=Sorex araneus TaxID=42254 RepID=UPI002433C9F2|nr:phospholipase A and acyltransferase 4-like [Sorex araneus]